MGGLTLAIPKLSPIPSNFLAPRKFALTVDGSLAQNASSEALLIHCKSNLSFTFVGQ
jgi:hypothetical protein